MYEEQKAIQKGWVSVPDAEEFFGIPKNVCYIQKHTKQPTYLKMINGTLYVNIKRLREYKDFHRRIWNESHDYYFRIIEETNNNRLGGILARFTGRSEGSWRDFLTRKLFDNSFLTRSLTATNIPDRLWEFYRVTRFIVRRTERHNTKIIEELYERLPNRDRYDEIYKERGCSR